MPWIKVTRSPSGRSVSAPRSTSLESQMRDPRVTSGTSVNPTHHQSPLYLCQRPQFFMFPMPVLIKMMLCVTTHLRRTLLSITDRIDFDWMPFADSTAADSHWPMRSLPIWNVPITFFANQAFANQDICRSDCISALCQSDICQFLESTSYETSANPIWVICQFRHLPIIWKPIVTFANQLEANSCICKSVRSQ